MDDGPYSSTYAYFKKINNPNILINMASWRFTDDYVATYPALTYSLLSFLVFSDHTLSADPENNFTGTLDVAATGIALQTLGALVNLPFIKVKGTVSEIDGTLTVDLTTVGTDTNTEESFKTAFTDLIPLLGQRITDSHMHIKTITNTTETVEMEPETDVFDLYILLTIAGATATINSTIPMNGGMFYLSGDFTDIAVGLSDLDFLMGNLGLDGDHTWFPNDKLQPYMDQGPELCLLNLTLTAFVLLEPSISIKISSVGVTVGLTQLPLLSEKLYMDPLSVMITLTDTSDSAIVPNLSWALMGATKLCSYDNPGVDGLETPDFEFDFSMGFPDSADDPSYFTVSADLENPSNSSVNKMLQDLISPDIDVGLADDLTVNSFIFETTANTTDGTISDFYTSIDMSGGFGLLENFDLEEISISVSYSE